MLDVSNASNPQPIGSAFDDSFAFDVAISGTTAVIAAGGGGVRLADVTDPRAPIELAGIDTPGYARGVAIADKLAVIADQWEGARIIDISRRIEVGSLATGSWAFDVAVAGSIAFVATGSLSVTSGRLRATTKRVTAPISLSRVSGLQIHPFASEASKRRRTCCSSSAETRTMGRSS